jgi:biotin carboxyl carrier protein
MKYVTEIEDGLSFEFDLEERNGEIRVSFGDRVHSVRLERPEPGIYTMFDGDDVFEASVSAGPGGTSSVQIGGRSFVIRVIDKKHQSRAGDHNLEGEQSLTAPMPGRVVKILKRAGEDVAAGEGVVVVEAMKMQNEIKSPKPGRIAEVRVTEGDTVGANQVLAVVE